METRYALRELEGVIGYDCRSLEDGRRAVFRHTGLHKRFRRDFFERRDMMIVMQSSFVAVAANEAGKFILHSKIEDKRRELLKVLFPYFDFGFEESVQEEDVNELFDELDNIIASQKTNAIGDSLKGERHDEG